MHLSKSITKSVRFKFPRFFTKALRKDSDKQHMAKCNQRLTRGNRVRDLLTANKAERGTVHEIN
jgi:hypothetical protein